jgi:hypothetical protein
MVKSKRRLPKVVKKCRRGYKFCRACRAEVHIHCYECPKCKHDLRPPKKNPQVLLSKQSR